MAHGWGSLQRLKELSRQSCRRVPRTMAHYGLDAMKEAGLNSQERNQALLCHYHGSCSSTLAPSFADRFQAFANSVRFALCTPSGPLPCGRGGHSISAVFVSRSLPLMLLLVLVAGCCALCCCCQQMNIRRQRRRRKTSPLL